eukprot:CAMPEP_0119144078 /NCGR_PEP_ID=MMETSP1310-20130426/35313_1 /TAXON_ID=464262 /ORGANISM="Genus nov. species nov., Strain RCC2339" /LENGTH=88 /DNA_ID=CAMNT_0007135765 /DNA_START=383 /DNA_END=649 /DNA_ORIENTATION=-
MPPDVTPVSSCWPAAAATGEPATNVPPGGSAGDLVMRDGLSASSSAPSSDSFSIAPSSPSAWLTDRNASDFRMGRRSERAFAASFPSF